MYGLTILIVDAIPDTDEVEPTDQHLGEFGERRPEIFAG